MNGTADALARTAAPQAPPWRGLLAYGLTALPLAMTALPVYVLVPAFYAEATGLALSTIGLVLLAARVLDALIDPLIGAWVDRAPGGYLRIVLAAAPVLALGFALLFLPPAGLSGAGAAAWLLAALLVATLGYSLASIAYQAWGARLAADDRGRAAVTAWREGLAVAGVVLAALLSDRGPVTLVAAFAVALVVALGVLVRGAPRPPAGVAPPQTALRALAAPLRSPRFRRLYTVFVVNGIAAAIPAALVLFFVADRLQAPAQSGALLALYFTAAALGMPVWAGLARRCSLPAAWLAGMLTAIGSFAWAAALGPGDVAAFAVICALSGFALGADLALPPALLARAIHTNRHAGGREGAYFGLWNFAAKVNLALAAGLALPALEALGYVPGARAPAALEALSFTYAAVPCALKLVAAALLLAYWRSPHFQENP